MTSAGGTMLITADHGNAETMRNDETGQPYTAHTLNVVPAIGESRRESRLSATVGLPT